MFINREIPSSEETQLSGEVVEQSSDVETSSVNGEGTHSSPSFR